MTDLLSRLTTPPPDEIAELIGPVEEYLADTEHWELADDSTPDPTPAYAALNKIVVALRAQVQEIEGLKTQQAADIEALRTVRHMLHSRPEAARIRELEQRSRELEAERDALRQQRDNLVKHDGDAIACLDSYANENQRISDERDTIRRKTIEECILALNDIPAVGESLTALIAAMDAIRALAHSESAEKEKSKE